MSSYSPYIFLTFPPYFLHNVYRISFAVVIHSINEVWWKSNCLSITQLKWLQKPVTQILLNMWHDHCLAYWVATSNLYIFVCLYVCMCLYVISCSKRPQPWKQLNNTSRCRDQSQLTLVKCAQILICTQFA